ncbi:MAG TPA: putative glycolipid-binding domain-containing protein, partial [Anaerolineae bacterium]
MTELDANMDMDHSTGNANNANAHSSIVKRKGIYQTFDAAGDVTADERWRIAGMLGGGARIDTDTVRIAPFAEPRNESFSLELGSQFAYSRLAIHAARDRRESRADFAAGRVSICWRSDDKSKTRDYDLATDCEIGYNSPLFTMVTLWRHALAVGQSSALRVIALDNVTFEPSWQRQVYTYLG